MDYNWRENFDTVEITVKTGVEIEAGGGVEKGEKKKENEKGKGKGKEKKIIEGDYISEGSMYDVTSVTFLDDISFLHDNYSGMENEDILISEEYIKIIFKKHTLHIDLYDKISIKKEDIRIQKNEHSVTLTLKKQEKCLWGFLHFFSLFVFYRNQSFPNLLKCTPEEKKQLWEEEKKFKFLINLRRMKSLENLKKKLKNEKKQNREFIKKMENEAQEIQLEMENMKREHLNMLKETVKAKAVQSIYEENFNIPKQEMKETLNEKNHIKTENIIEQNNLFISKTDSNRIEEKEANEKPVVIPWGNTMNKVIELKFTELKKDQIPARESRSLKKKSTNYSSTKNFFLIILIEKAKKLFFKNSDFMSCLETLKSISELSAGEDHYLCSAYLCSR